MPGIEKTMHEFKHGSLHSGSKNGPVIKNKKQAIAIALSENKKEDTKSEIYEKLRKRK